MSKEPIVPAEEQEADDSTHEQWGTYTGATVLVPRREHQSYAAKAGWWCLSTVEAA